MKRLASNQELETLGTLMVRDYLEQSGKWEARCFDIESFIRDYLNVKIYYEYFAEEDPGRLGFCANGCDMLLVLRNGEKEGVIFPKDTIVIERFLLRDDQSAKKRFTMAHEAAHVILNRHIPGQAAAAFHSEFDSSQDYDNSELKKIFSLEESQADRLGSALLMPQYHVEKALAEFNGSKPVTGYDGDIFSQDMKFLIQNMADSLGTSYTALIIRLKSLGRIEYHPIREYLKQGLGFGGGC